MRNNESLTERAKYVSAWNRTMITIWQEQITLLGVMDTKSLLHSPKAIPVRTDGSFREFTVSEVFLEYGLWQDYGTGRETPRGNSGDIGRVKVRQRRQWFSKKYYSSVLNLRDFLADNIGKEFVGIIADTFDKKNYVANL